MQQQQGNDQDHFKLSYSEKKLIEELRFHKFDAPSAEELDHLEKWRKIKMQQNLDLAAFIEIHQDDLAGAINKLLTTYVHQGGALSYTGAQQAYSILLIFYNILVPPPEMDM